MPDRPRLKKVVAIDWDLHTLRVVHALIGKRGVKVDRLLSVAMPPDLDSGNPQQIGLHIRRTLDQEDIGTRYGVVDIPRDQAILKTLKLPVAQPEELPGMVEIQIAKELPFPVREAVIDFVAAPVSADQTNSDVLVAAVRREQLEQYEAVFLAAGLKLDRIGLRPHANKVAVCEILKHAMPERVLFIDVRPTFMEIDVLWKSSLAFSRSASVVIPKGIGEAAVFPISGKAAGSDAVATPLGAGAQETGSRDQIVASLVIEVRRSIEAYRATDPGAMIDHVVIGGDVGVEEALGEALQKSLNVTAEIYNPASTFGWDPDEGAGAAGFAASLGLALGQAQVDTPHFDFLHPKKTVSVAKERLRKAPVTAGVVVVFAALAAVVVAQITGPARARLASLEQDVALLEAKRGENTDFLKLLKDVKDFDARQHVWVDVLYDVIGLLPGSDEMLLTHVEMNQNDSRLTLKTKAKHRETATEVIRTLEEFREEGREKPRFKVTMGPQSEKKRDKYPFVQDLRVLILEDQPGKRGVKRASSDT